MSDTSATAKLLKLFHCDKMLRGLKTRLTAAERFLSEQQRQLTDLDTRHASLTTQVRALSAAIHNDEVEVASIDARMAKLRDQMNSAKTNKEYTAFLTELNTLKEKKDTFEKHELEQMEKKQALDGQLADVTGQREGRQRLVAQATTDRDAKSAEIKDRVDELSSQRAALAADVPKKELAIFEDLVRLRGDEAMSPVEVLDRRAHEYTCAGCQMTLPVETVNKIAKGHFVLCVSCSCILYSEQLDLHKPGEKKAADSLDGATKPKKPRKPKAAKPAETDGQASPQAETKADAATPAPAES